MILIITWFILGLIGSGLFIYSCKSYKKEITLGDLLVILIAPTTGLLFLVVAIFVADDHTDLFRKIIWKWDK